MSRLAEILEQQNKNTLARAQLDVVERRFAQFPLNDPAITDDERGFWENLAESWRRGETDDELRLALYKAFYENNDPEIKQRALQAYQKHNRREQIDPIDGNLITDLMYGTARVLPPMLTGISYGVLGIGLGAGAGAAVGGVVGGPPGAAAGATLGAKFGGTTGATLYFYKQAAGQMIGDMIEQGLEENTARNIAGAAAIPYALIETLSVLSLGKAQFLKAGAAKVGQKVAQKALMQKTSAELGKRFLKKYGTMYAEEVSEEVLQEAVQVAAEDIGHVIDQKKLPIDKGYFTDRANRLLQTGLQAGKAMALLPIPGAMVQANYGTSWAGPEVPPTMPTVAQEPRIPLGVGETTLQGEIARQTPQDAERALVIWQQYLETGDPAILEDMPPGGMINISPEQVSDSLAATLNTSAKRAEFKKNLNQAIIEVERGDAQRSDLINEVIAYQKIWGEIDSLSLDVLRYMGVEQMFKKTPPGAIAAEQAPAGAEGGKQGPPPPPAPPAAPGMPEPQPGTPEYMAHVIRQSIPAREIEKEARGPKLAEAFAAETEIPKETRGRARLYTWLSKFKGTGFQRYKDFAGKFTGEQADIYLDMVFAAEAEHKITRAQKLTLATAMDEFFKDGKLLEPAQIQLAELVFGKGVAEAFLDARKAIKEEPLFHRLVPYLQIPKTLRAMFDMSHPGRQGLMFISSPGLWWKNLKAQTRNWFKTIGGSDTVHKQIAKNIKLDDDYNLIHDEMGVLYHEHTKTGPRAEYYETPLVSEFTEKWEKQPGVSGAVGMVAARAYKASEFSFTDSGNYLRFLQAKKFLTIMRNLGVTPTSEQLKAVGRIINLMSGEGSLKFLGRYATTASVLFFAPRLIAGRIQMLTAAANPVAFFRAAKYAVQSRDLNVIRSIYKKEPAWALAAGSLVKTTAIIGSFIAAVGLAQKKFRKKERPVELNPESSDFGKIKMGRTKIDLLGGYGPLIRTVTRLVTGRAKTEIGRKIPVDSYETIVQFIRSKLSPVPAAMWDLTKGETFYGDDIALDAENVVEQLAHQFVPFFIEDLIDAAKNEGLYAAGVGTLPAFIGLGLQTYEPSPTTKVQYVKDKYALQTYHTRWDELGPDFQKALRMNFPDIGETEVKVRYEREQQDTIDISEQRQSSENITKKLPKDIQRSLVEIQIPMPGFSRRAGDWYVNDRRFRQMERETVNMLSEWLPKVTKTTAFKNMPAQYQRKIVIDLMEDVRRMVRQKVMYEATARDFIRLEQLKNKSRGRIKR